jgi:hypothetical protein
MPEPVPNPTSGFFSDPIPAVFSDLFYDISNDGFSDSITESVLRRYSSFYHRCGLRFFSDSNSGAFSDGITDGIWDAYPT